MRQVVITGRGTAIGTAVAAAFAQDANVVVITGQLIHVNGGAFSS